MKTLVKTKLLEGKYLELRDYNLFKGDLKVILCSTKNYKSCFHVKEPYMTLTVKQQEKGKVTNTQQSKFPPYKYYKLYKFLWKPKAVQEQTNLTDKKIRYEGNTAIIE